MASWNFLEPLQRVHSVHIPDCSLLVAILFVQLGVGLSPSKKILNVRLIVSISLSYLWKTHISPYHIMEAPENPNSLVPNYNLVELQNVKKSSSKYNSKRRQCCLHGFKGKNEVLFLGFTVCILKHNISPTFNTIIHTKQTFLEQA
ncbi:hypothetical protein O6H91_18G038400 [Diphasiastrum complanatum]|uniref:Uncharacterized protein n=1 Tax=Diphasiastrum complanatum TaxID=34168 RepID=A0ACC2B009_DIPCM|nr:hypothetical protein O6H91_18G038400 [Diphasiastrum complanatum]